MVCAAVLYDEKEKREKKSKRKKEPCGGFVSRRRYGSLARRKVMLFLASAKRDWFRWRLIFPEVQLVVSLFPRRYFRGRRTVARNSDRKRWDFFQFSGDILLARKEGREGERGAENDYRQVCLRSNVCSAPPAPREFLAVSGFIVGLVVSSAKHANGRYGLKTTRSPGTRWLSTTRVSISLLFSWRFERNEGFLASSVLRDGERERETANGKVKKRYFFFWN